MNTAQEAAHAAPTAHVTFREPGLEDGQHLWRMAKDSGTLDLNSPYAYLLFGSAFSETCLIAEADGEPVGFVMGLRLPRDPEALFVWQVAVDPSQRGKRLASRMLDELIERLRPSVLEATVTPSNGASMALFRSLAKRAGVESRETAFIQVEDFPEPGHEAEVLLRIGPLRR
ncbi:MAG: diaminobutyrate acetyltransferase [Planctomycetota bacterium]|mgnify:CR=1 FL=1|jgi:diaminobutyrate acetyltransferase